METLATCPTLAWLYSDKYIPIDFLQIPEA